MRTRKLLEFDLGYTYRVELIVLAFRLCGLLIDTYRALRIARRDGRSVGALTRRKAMRGCVKSWIVYVRFVQLLNSLSIIPTSSLFLVAIHFKREIGAITAFQRPSSHLFVPAERRMHADLFVYPRSPSHTLPHSPTTSSPGYLSADPFRPFYSRPSFYSVRDYRHIFLTRSLART